MLTQRTERSGFDFLLKSGLPKARKEVWASLRLGLSVMGFVDDCYRLRPAFRGCTDCGNLLQWQSGL